MDDLTSTEIRSLRGGQTRATFAQLIGVNPHTVYRWELPEGSAHARRPRGTALAKLKSLATKLPDPALVPVMSAVERALDGRQWHDAENVLLRAQQDRTAGAEARAMAATGLALIDLVYRADGRRALAALASAMSPDAPPSALTEATAALAYSYPDGELFDLGRVHAHAMRSDDLAHGEAPIAQAFAATAVANAALLAGDDDLMLRALGRVDAIASASLPGIPALFLDMLRAYAATMAGHNELALERLDRILANPLTKESPNLEARTAAARAMRMLENLGAPEEALALARRARAIGDEGNLAIGVHTALALRAECEALLRLGRLDEARDVFVESDRIFDVLRFPVTIVFPIQIRYLQYTSQPEALEALAAKLGAVELPSMRAICQAYAAWASATALFTRGGESLATMAAFAHAERLSSGWGFLRRDLLTAFANVAFVEGTTDEARAALERAQRAAERRPSAWVTAHLKRAEGTLLVNEGRIEEGRTLLDAATATFDASGDRVAAAYAHYGAAGIARLTGEADAEARTFAAEAELAALGLHHPRWIDRAMTRAAQALATQTEWPRREAIPTVLTPSLELSMQRVAVAGASFAMVIKELVSVVKQLTGGPAVIEDEQHQRMCDTQVDGPVVAWFDIKGGTRRLRLGITKPLADGDHAALRVLVLVAGLALQIVGLRGSERTSASPEVVVPDVPGLIVASAAMRRLLGDVTRLAGSRATVTITGESGAGKEVIARALHELSPRAAKPYIAFNCAAVPHDLFEGQLFGYKKGAFTGANADHAGVIRAADGGTLFLDEIGELPLDIQPKLLRFLDAGEVFPLGAERPLTVDVRVIAATNRDLATEVARGRFRQDLFYRLHVVPLVVPPLRERRDDIVPLARHFVRLISGDRRAPTLAPDALAALRDYAWPGNVRELRNVIERALAYADGPNDVLTRAQLKM
jgi:tetratricopeptide (TPR) repeat protein